MFEIKRGKAELTMSGKIHYYIDEDGDISMDQYERGMKLRL